MWCVGTTRWQTRDIIALKMIIRRMTDDYRQDGDRRQLSMCLGLFFALRDQILVGSPKEF